MATKAKATSPCLSFLKDSLLLPTRNAKLFVPVLLLIAVPTFLLPITNIFFIEPLTTGFLRRVDEINNTDPSSPDYAKLGMEFLKEGSYLAFVVIAVSITFFLCGAANQIVASFAASATYSGNSYSLSELFSKVIMKGRRLRGPLITVAMVGVLHIACMMVLVVLDALLLQLIATPHWGPLYQAGHFVLQKLAFLYLTVVFAVAVAASVADTECRGVGALRQAWRLMTRVRRKEGCVLVVGVLVRAMVPSPLEAAALGYSKKSMPMGLALRFVDALLSALVELFYFAAVMVYYHHAMESKEVTAQGGNYAMVPTGEATV